MQMRRLIMALAAIAPVAHATTHSESFQSLAARCAPGVDLSTLTRVVSHESGFDPYQINVNGGYSLPRKPATKAEAVATARWLYAKGYSFDSGLGQYNSLNLERSGVAIEDLFDPCENLKASSAVLVDCYSRAVGKIGEGQQALRAALNCYNSGKFVHPQGNRYVNLIAANATLPVPALIVTDDAGPVKLRRGGAAELMEMTAEPPTKLPARRVEGLSDAFAQPDKPGASNDSVGIGDAFSAERNAKPADLPDEDASPKSEAGADSQVE